MGAPASALPLAKASLENADVSIRDVQLGDLIGSDQRPAQTLRNSATKAIEIHIGSWGKAGDAKILLRLRAHEGWQYHTCSGCQLGWSL